MVSWLQNFTLQELITTIMAKAGKVKDQLVRELIRLKRKSCRSGLKSGDIHQVFLNSCTGFHNSGSTQSNNNTSGIDRASTGNGSVKSTNSRKTRRTWKRRLLASVITLVPVVIGILYLCHTSEYSWDDFVEDVRLAPCIIENNFFIMEMARPLAPCSMCKNLTEVPHYHLIDREVFLAKHAYTGRPVVISGATVNWTAMQTFSFNFFRDLYHRYPGSFDKLEDECQFFPYNTDFESLEEVFNMTDNQASMKEGEPTWYIGW